MYNTYKLINCLFCPNFDFYESKHFDKYSASEHKNENVLSLVIQKSKRFKKIQR